MVGTIRPEHRQGHEQAPEPTPSPCSSAAPCHVRAGSPARAATHDIGPGAGKTKPFKHVSEGKVNRYIAKGTGS